MNSLLILSRATPAHKIVNEILRLKKEAKIRKFIYIPCQFNRQKCLRVVISLAANNKLHLIHRHTLFVCVLLFSLPLSLFLSSILCAEIGQYRIVRYVRFFFFQYRTEKIIKIFNLGKAVCILLFFFIKTKLPFDCKQKHNINK